MIEHRSAVGGMAGGIGVDCKGRNLFRSGTLELETVFVPPPTTTIFVFDVPALGGAANSALKDLLSNEQLIKCMYDCRNDADALMCSPTVCNSVKLYTGCHTCRHKRGRHSCARR